MDPPVVPHTGRDSSRHPCDVSRRCPPLDVHQSVTVGRQSPVLRMHNQWPEALEGLLDAKLTLPRRSRSPDGKCLPDVSCPRAFHFRFFFLSLSLSVRALGRLSFRGETPKAMKKLLLSCTLGSRLMHPITSNSRKEQRMPVPDLTYRVHV